MIPHLPAHISPRSVCGSRGVSRRL